MSTKLTKHFSLEELTRSRTATRLGINNTPSVEEMDNLKKLANEVLEPLREYLGSPIRVNSGFRAPELNRAIGGATTSMHCVGAAADIEAKGFTPREVARIAHETVWRDCKWGRIILEFPEDGWVHIECQTFRVHKSGPLLIAEKVDGRRGPRTVYREVENFRRELRRGR